MFSSSSQDGGNTSPGDESVRTLIDRQALASPDAIFIIDPAHQQQITFRQLQKAVRGVAAYLHEKGVPDGDSVAFAMHNGSHCALIILGIMYGGYRAVAINLVAGRDVIAYVLAHSLTRLVFTQSEHQALLDEALSSASYTDSINEFADSLHLEFSSAEPQADPQADLQADSQLSPQALPSAVVVNRDWFDKTERKAERQTGWSALSSRDDALLMYTSGTTGKPKGVVLSHGNVIAGGRNVALGHELHCADRALCVLPLYHINGMCVTLFAPLVTGGSVVLPQKFSTRAFWPLIDEFECSWFSVVPTQIAYLLRDADNDDSSEFTVVACKQLRFGRSASAPLSPDVHGSFEKRFGVPLIETMGLTETAAQILTNPMAPAVRKLGSPGVPVGDDVIVVDASLQEVSADTEGELLVRGSNVMQRYFRNPEATQQAILSGGWLRTGDLGRKDSDGYVYITGRLKELIIKGGENIAPREIDDALYQHQDVVEAAAFACPCEDFGQRVEAAVSIKTGSPLSETDLLQLCLSRVGKFKCPDRIHFLDELPKGPSGKIQRAKILSVVR